MVLNDCNAIYSQSIYYEVYGSANVMDMSCVNNVKTITGKVTSKVHLSRAAFMQ